MKFTKNMVALEVESRVIRSAAPSNVKKGVKLT